ncbi:MAG: cytochrome c [Bacteroidetes bacterium]|nr:MAG: cytochrome c [Bacteroidota bacterium]
MNAKHLFSLLFIAGFALVITTAFESRSNANDPWVVPSKYQNMKNPVTADKESLSIGKSLYTKHCKSCHGTKGLGDGTKAAQLKTKCGDFSSADFQGQTDGSLFYKTSEGRDDMPSFKKKIPVKEDIWHVVNYMRTFAK